MTQLQQIATLIRSLEYKEMIELGGKLYGRVFAKSSFAGAHDAADTLIDLALSILEDMPDPAYSQPAKYPYSGAVYNLKAMKYEPIYEPRRDISALDRCFVLAATPQGFGFWNVPSVQFTPEGQSYLDDMKAQYEREQKEGGK